MLFRLLNPSLPRQNSEQKGLIALISHVAQYFSQNGCLKDSERLRDAFLVSEKRSSGSIDLF